MKAKILIRNLEATQVEISVESLRQKGVAREIELERSLLSSAPDLEDLSLEIKILNNKLDSTSEVDLLSSLRKITDKLNELSGSDPKLIVGSHSGIEVEPKTVPRE